MVRKKKKKFGQTTVGKILKGAVGLINPTLGSVLEGAVSVEDAIAGIGKADASPEEKIRAKEMILEAYEAEVSDRIAARHREASVAMAGGNDFLFKAIGISISAAFLIMVAGAVGWITIELEGSQKDLYNMAFGAVTAKMTQVVSYYFGSSLGSKQKTAIMEK